MNTVSINMIIDVNKLIADKKLDCKVHLRDACGSQSMWIEPESDKTIPSEVYDIIKEYFSAQRMKLEFNTSNTDFRVVG